MLPILKGSKKMRTVKDLVVFKEIWKEAHVHGGDKLARVCIAPKTGIWYQGENELPFKLMLPYSY